MSLSSELKAQADAFLDDLDIQMAPLQASFLISNGKYCPLPPTHDVMPADGIAVAPNGNKKISGYPSWNDLGINLPATCKACAQVHVYEGPQGHGYVRIGDIKQGGVHYKDGKNFGPESNHDADWMKIFPSTAGA